MGTTRALALLARLERGELDRERGAVAAAVEGIAAAAAEVARLDGRFGEELGLALDLPDGPRFAAAYARGHTVRREAAMAKRQRIEAELPRLEAAVKERAVALRTYELAADRVSAREQAAAAQAAQALLDEVAVLRHGAVGAVA